MKDIKCEDCDKVVGKIEFSGARVYLDFAICDECDEKRWKKSKERTDG